MLSTPLLGDNSPNIKPDLYVTETKQQIDTDSHHAFGGHGIRLDRTAESQAMHQNCGALAVMSEIPHFLHPNSKNIIQALVPIAIWVSWMISTTQFLTGCKFTELPD